MTPEERQRCRDRAADGIAPRSSVLVNAGGWPKPLDPKLAGRGPTERRRVHRERAKAMS